MRPRISRSAILLTFAVLFIPDQHLFSATLQGREHGFASNEIREPLLRLFELSAMLMAACLAFWNRRKLTREVAARKRLEARLAEELRQRRMIAREVKGVLAQRLAGMSDEIEVAKRAVYTSQQKSIACLSSVQRELRASLSESQRIAMSLRAGPSETDLLTGLEQVGRRLTRGAAVHFFARNIGIPQSIDADLRMHLITIGREALQNALSHSGAKNVWFELKWDSAALHFGVRDDGVGFEVHKCLTEEGLRKIEQEVAEIGGRCEVRSSPRCGTEVWIRVGLCASGSCLV